MMPIQIYDRDRENHDPIAELSPNEWELATQISDLGKWLDANISEIAPGKYVADIGFMVRKNTTGGGAVISSEIISNLNDLGMEVYLSEYGEHQD